MRHDTYGARMTGTGKSGIASASAALVVAAALVLWAPISASATLPNLSDLAPADACARLQGASIPETAIGLPTTGARVESVQFVAADAPDNGNGEHCRVMGAIHPVSYNAPDIRFQVNLPTAWNGKTLHFGGGGFNGRLVTGLTRYVKQPESEPAPLARGYVTYGSDAGHQSETLFDGRFMLNDEALRNYGHEQLKKTRDVAAELVKARYGALPRLRYFAGGSQGGHEAFDVVQRYPDDYDGVIAGYPAHNVVMLHLSANRYARALHDAWIGPSEARTVSAAVYAACDGLDGATDGIISHVAACREATSGLRVRGPENPVRCEDGNDAPDACLSDAQIETLIVMDTPYDLGFSVFADDDGNSIFPKWTPFEGSTFFDGNFPNLGSEGPGQALQFLPGDATPRYAIAQDLAIDSIYGFDPRRYAGRIAELAHRISANSVNLDRYRQRGGKLILFHGAVDDFIPVYSSIEYFERLRERYGDAPLEEFVRFYVIPGMGHVTGTFNARISTLDALEAWVERGAAPGNLLGTDANETTEARTRPVCRYPAWPRYRGQGDPDDASSFDCVFD